MTHSLQSQLKAANFRIASLKMQIAAKDAVIRDLKMRRGDSHLAEENRAFNLRSKEP